MNANKILALLLTLALLLGLAACGGQGDESSASKESTGSAVDEPSSSSQSSLDSSEASTPEEDNGSVHPLRIVQAGTLPSAYEEGIAATNQKLKEDGLNIEVSVQRIPWDTYNEKMNLMLTSGEEFEMMHVMQDVKNLSNMAGLGGVISLEPYLDKYPDLVDKFNELEWAGCLYNGERWAVPCVWRSFDNTMSYILGRMDVMKAVGYEEFPTEVDDYITMLEKEQAYILEETGVKAYSWFHQNQDTAHWLHRTYDTYPFYVENSLGVVLARQDGAIDSFYESEEFKKDCEVYYEMYQKGLVNPDILNMDAQVKYDQADLGAFLPSQASIEPSREITIKNNTGIETEIDWREFAPDKPEMVYTFVQNINAVSSTAEDPETPLKFLNWLYTSQENHDLYHYGIEGTHYTRVDENHIDKVLGDDGNPIYDMGTWQTGYIPYMDYAATDPDRHIGYMTYKADNYVVSPIAGFLFDSTPVATELTNLQTEIMASIYPIKVGMVSYEDNIDEAITKLKAAGLDAYLEEYRKQFSAYLEANPQVMEMAKGTTAG